MTHFESLEIIESPEFINVEPTDLNPLMSRCQIKVFYLGENRNHTFIDKPTATKMAKTLRGVPIVGYYKEDVGDFRDHGDSLEVDYDQAKYKCKTFPYGFVSPDSKIWFQKYQEKDAKGNTVIREYLLCEGYLWTGQYPECQCVIDEGKPHSMEIDNETLKGQWSKNKKTNIDFFIVNDATFYKMCILGDDVEPCFEGSTVTAAPKTEFVLDENFKYSLYNMMQELKFALQGGKNMENENKIEQQGTETPAPAPVENETPASTPTEYKKEEETKPAPDEEKKSESDSNSETKDKKEEDKDKKAEEKYTALEAKFNELSDKYALVEKELSELRAFKASADDKEKDALIGNFYMLSDEDKADVIKNKSQYTLDEIEQKLSVICFRKKVNFNLNDTEEIHNNTEEGKKEDISTYSLNDNVDSCPAWIKAVKETRDSSKDI